MKHVGSFSLEIPTIFGKNKDARIVILSKVLAVKDALVSILDNGRGVIHAMITENLAGDPKRVASAMSDESTTFWREISNWMTSNLLQRAEDAQQQFYQGVLGACYLLSQGYLLRHLKGEGAGNDKESGEYGLGLIAGPQGLP